MDNVKKWNYLFSKAHLVEHFHEKVKLKASIGLDRVTVSKFEKTLDDEIDIIVRKVKKGTYSFTRYRQLLFSKGAKKEPRVISVPTVRDKLVSSVLNEFLVEVYGEQCKSPLPHTIISRIQSELSSYDYYIKIDISHFYSSINHKKLMRVIRRKIRKKEIVSLIENAITTETIPIPNTNPSRTDKATEGIPEGLPISNALANIFMSDFDKKYGSNPSIRYFRYVDDILILLSAKDSSTIYNSLRSDIKKHKLRMNEDKFKSGEVSNSFTYLGYDISSSYTSVRQSSVYKLENSIEELVKECARHNHKYIEWKLNLKITGFILDEHKYGWMFFYSQITDTSVLHHLDWFIDRILERYNLKGDIHTKKFVRSYYEITKKLHSTTYIPNISNLSVDEKKRILSKIYEEKIDDLTDSQIEYTFRKIMKKEIQNVERDIENFS